MKEAVHQLMQLILQGFTWVLRTIEALWVWSWNRVLPVRVKPVMTGLGRGVEGG